MEMSPERFEAIVVRALESLPDEFVAALDNLTIVIEDEPTPKDLQAMGLGGDEAGSLFGLYVGLPKTEQGHWDLVTPDKIAIYKTAILNACQNDAEVEEEVRTTLLHEIGHYFGIDDDRLEDLGWD